MSNEEDRDLLALTTEIVAAYVTSNTVSSDQLSGVINTVYGSLKSVGAVPSSEIQAVAAPAVSVRKSVTPDAIICLNCGKSMKMLKRHLTTEHGLSIAEYKAHWNLASDYPSVAPNYAASRSAMAKKIGLGQKPKAKRGRKPKAS